ncbi:MAG TPA: YkgJ family cysteine cluster protein [Haliangiales bacterium]|nr:YkgJ family cysteine cluster protein [Haliangiales bacterium]
MAERAPEAIAARDGELRADLDAGLRFAHVLGSQAKRGVVDFVVAVEALVEEMVESGRVDAARLAERTDRVRAGELKRMEEHERIILEPALNKYSMTGLPDIPCGELIPLCRGRCCTLHFPLSKQDLGERVVKWNYTQPYLIRQGDNGYCVHNDPETKFCTVYHHRPAVCRYYDCRKDKRIWLDFDKRIPAVDPSLTPREAPTPLGPPPEFATVEADRL